MFGRAVVLATTQQVAAVAARAEPSPLRSSSSLRTSTGPVSLRFLAAVQRSYLPFNGPPYDVGFDFTLPTPSAACSAVQHGVLAGRYDSTFRREKRN